MRWLKIGIVAVGCHGDASSRIGRAHRGLRGDHLRRADRACTAEHSDGGRSGAEDGAGRLFCLAMQSAPAGGAAENSRLKPLRGWAACRPIALRKAVGPALSNTQTSSQPTGLRR